MESSHWLEEEVGLEGGGRAAPVAEEGGAEGGWPGQEDRKFRRSTRFYFHLTSSNLYV